METVSALLAICAGSSPSLVNSPHKGQWRGAVMSSFCIWVNNGEAGDMRRYRAHYDVTVMTCKSQRWCKTCMSWGFISEVDLISSNMMLTSRGCSNKLNYFAYLYGCQLIPTALEHDLPDVRNKLCSNHMEYFIQDNMVNLKIHMVLICP